MLSFQGSGFAYGSGGHLDKTSTLCLLQNLSRLESLNLEDTLIEDEASFSLALLKQLNCLYLKRDSLSDASLHNLLSLANLKFLGFRNAMISDSGLRSLMPKALRILDLRGCWSLTRDALSSFSEQHPQIELRHELIEMILNDRNRSAGSTSRSAGSTNQLKSGEQCKGSSIGNAL